MAGFKRKLGRALTAISPIVREHYLQKEREKSLAARDKKLDELARARDKISREAAQTGIINREARAEQRLLGKEGRAQTRLEASPGYKLSQAQSRVGKMEADLLQEFYDAVDAGTQGEDLQRIVTKLNAGKAAKAGGYTFLKLLDETGVETLIRANTRTGDAEPVKFPTSGAPDPDKEDEGEGEPGWMSAILDRFRPKEEGISAPVAKEAPDAPVPPKGSSATPFDSLMTRKNNLESALSKGQGSPFWAEKALAKVEADVQARLEHLHSAKTRLERVGRSTKSTDDEILKIEEYLNALR